MKYNNIKIAWRQIGKKKLDNLINLVGLIFGITFFMIVAAYTWDVQQVNSKLKDSDQQYLLQSAYKKEGFGINLTTVGALPKALYESYPNLIKNYYRIDGITCIVSTKDAVYEESVALGDATFLTMFGFSLWEGNPNTALQEPYTVVLTEQAALKYFGKLDVLQEKLKIKNFHGEQEFFTVTGVIKGEMENSVLQLTPAMESELFISTPSETHFGRSIDNWQNPYIAGFITLQKDVQPAQLEAPIRKLIQQHTDTEFAAAYSPVLKPLTTYFLDDNNGAVRNMITTLNWIAAFVLLMAFINFINFSISQHLSRLKEIGVRKIMGSSTLQITLQLLTEYLVMLSLAALISLPLYQLSLPLFENILLRKLPSLRELPLYFYGLMALCTVIMALLAGIYPALKLASSKSINAVKLQLNQKNDKQTIRKGLLFIQFLVALVLLMSTLIISKQMDVFIKGDMGYNKDYLLSLQVPRNWNDEGVKKMEVFRNALMELPQINNISLSYHLPGLLGGDVRSLYNESSEKESQAQVITSDAYFADTYQIPMLDGQFFSAYQAAEAASQQVVINKKAAEDLGFNNPADAVGKQIAISNYPQKVTITGVTDNFIANNMHSDSPPIVWVNVASSAQYRFFTIRFNEGPISSALDALEKEWKKLQPDAPFVYQFMDERIRQSYSRELQLHRASQVATVISLVIVFIGITGLISLTINMRNKEVGIRKVLGASFLNLVWLFSKEYYLLFTLAAGVAIPATYLLMNEWLQQYVLRTPVAVLSTYLLPTLLLFLILALLIAVIIVRTSPTKIIDKLRDE